MLIRITQGELNNYFPQQYAKITYTFLIYTASKSLALIWVASTALYMVRLNAQHTDLVSRSPPSPSDSPLKLIKILSIFVSI